MEAHHSRVEVGGIDPLTTFRDRRSLFNDIERAVDPNSPSSVLAVFDLAGLEQYRTMNGILAADEVISRLARCFDEVMGAEATCYRGRSDEFWALIDGSLFEVRPLLDAAVRALCEEGRPFSVRAGFGIVFLPDEAKEPIDALIIADRELGAARRLRERRKSPRSRGE